MDYKNRKVKKQQSVDDGVTVNSYEMHQKGKKGLFVDEPFVKVPSTFKNKRATEGVIPRLGRTRNSKDITNSA